MELQRLVTGAKLGNNDDFSALVRLYQRRLLISVQAVVRDRTLAEDVVQEAFVRAWSGLASLRNAEVFPAWLWSIARNLARTQYRKDAEQGAEFDVGELADPRSLTEADPVCGWEGLMNGLTQEQRSLVELRHGVGLSLRQMGAVLGIPEKTVKSRLFSLRQKLKKTWDASVPTSSSGCLWRPKPTSP